MCLYYEQAVHKSALKNKKCFVKEQTLFEKGNSKTKPLCLTIEKCWKVFK